MANEAKSKAQALAEEILILSRNTLAINLRFMNRALFNIPFRYDDKLILASEGRHVFFNTAYILSLYKSEQEKVTRALLHTILHLVYRHMFIGPGVDRECWDLAADCAVEIIIESLKLNCVSTSEDAARNSAAAKLRDIITKPTAERIYSELLRNKELRSELLQSRTLFLGDVHAFWYEGSEETIDYEVNTEELWEDISKRIETELELIEKDDSSMMVQTLKEINRTRYDYSSFLRRFGVFGERLHISEEEFDNNYYCYGLEHYGNMPLIENLEYSERRGIRNFVIAIDTSGSVKGEIVQKFIQHTHDILMKQESFFTRVNIHVIQCDDQIREDVVLNSVGDFKQYISHMEIKGLGKTDFRPVFNYVDKLIESKKLRNLQGIIYFTDGLGTFPTSRPAYPVAFIINDDEYGRAAVPKWASTLHMNDEEILALGKT